MGRADQLDAGFADTALARTPIDAGMHAMERVEAGVMLGIEGGNAETRKARLTLALADDARHEAARCQVAARQALADADRRVLVTRGRCRLLRAARSLAVGAWSHVREGGAPRAPAWGSLPGARGHLLLN